MKYLALVTALVMLVACKTETTTKPVAEETKEIAPITDDVLETAVIYEANIRQYSNEGTFDAFTKDIPQLKELGVKVIWLMPIFPISETKRKATGGDFASLIEDEAEREKMLGSYYAVSDFTEVNPEFGTKEDFRELLQTAHDNGIYVILDWVPNHTGWDHKWLETNPEYYTQNEAGEVIDPVNPETGESWGWADVADLNYDNQELRKQMIADMNYWLKEVGVDGFRCDVAGAVPQDFWEQAVPQLRQTKDIFMLAEAWEPELMKGEDLFDMAYSWEGHHVMNQVASKEKDASAWDAYMADYVTRYEDDDMLMYFVTNHDENSWNGTIEERMGDNAEAMTALAFMAKGMPLIYSGQEYDLSHRLKFFEKDSIPKTKGKSWELLKNLAELKQTNPALNGGKNAGAYEKLSTSNEKDILAFKREKDGNTVIYVSNMAKEPITFTLASEGEFIDAMTGAKVVLQMDGDHTFKPHQFMILTNE